MGPSRLPNAAGFHVMPPPRVPVVRYQLASLGDAHRFGITFLVRADALCIMRLINLKGTLPRVFLRKQWMRRETDSVSPHE